ncbi:DUF2147 domain-containing protein [Qipengyuania sediminis]|uniref:DUF2147 domain-containing protein n=1 Tax=Qipengyuania sediminis TaxID=1532023 RepID=UPI001F1137CB|nr:DUF2147 domain-containing protein [Qipengyuania sediminis]
MRRLVFMFAAGLFAAQPLAAAEPVTGRWLTADRDAIVAIGPCGDKLCGTIARFLVAPPQGNDQRDVNNRDAAKRSRKLLGMPILMGFTPDNESWRGTIYDPKSGKTYRSVLQRAGETLKVKGCVAVFCQTQTWTRAR